MRRLLYFLGAVIALLLILAFGALQALKTEAVRTRIASALSNSLGQPVTIGGLSLSLLPIPALSAKAVRIGGAGPAAAPGISVTALRAVPRLSSLLPGRTRTIDQVELKGLVISVRRDTAGRWLLPVAPVGGVRADTGTAATGIDLSRIRVRDGAIRMVDDRLRAASGGPRVTAITGIEATMQALGGRVRIPEMSGHLGQTVVSGSTAMDPTGARIELRTESVHPEDLPALFALAGMEPYPGLSIAGKAPLEMSVSFAPGFANQTATGTAAIGRMSLKKLALENVRAPFRFEHEVLTLDPLTFNGYGGRGDFTVSVDRSKPTAAYTLRGSLQGLDVNQALSQTTTMKNMVEGKARLNGNVRGSGDSAAAIARTLAGTLKFEMTDGVLRNFPLLAAINRALGLTEGTDRDTRFQSLSGTATVGGGRARSNDLALRAGELTLTGSGSMGFDRSLDLRMVAGLSPALTQQLAERVGALGRLANDRGQLAFPVRITGTMTAPKIAVDVGSIAKQQLRKGIESGLLNKLFQ
jgi:uncharacterized protein involved in outer membrane biogenesis